MGVCWWEDFATGMPGVQHLSASRPDGGLMRSQRPTRRLLVTNIEHSSVVYNRTYVLIEWDPSKARLNARKHGISFAEAVACLEDEGALTMRDPFSGDEERWVAMGLDVLGRVLVVVYTWRGERVRLISARKATARERRRYEDAE